MPPLLFYTVSKVEIQIQIFISGFISDKLLTNHSRLGHLTNQRKALRKEGFTKNKSSNESFETL